MLIEKKIPLPSAFKANPTTLKERKNSRTHLADDNHDYKQTLLSLLRLIEI